MRHLLILLLMVLFSFSVFAQSRDHSKPHFKDGLYLNFKQVKTNSPIPKVRIRTNLDYANSHFFDELVQNEYIVFYDNLGNSEKVKTEQIWGYCNRGTLYINVHNQFNRIPVLGSISHFTALYSYTEYRSPYSTYSYYDRYNTTAQNKTELRQYVLDFETGEVREFNYKTMEVLLSNDPELMEEYTSLSRRKKRKMKFYYLRQYNEKHPLEFNE